MPPCDLIDKKTVLVKEREALGLKDSEQPTALCLSGGGIRSAAFCLGVLQALARREQPVSAASRDVNPWRTGTR